MHLDFWNNPIVVSAFRVQMRRGGLFTITSIYVMLLVAGGGVGSVMRLRVVLCGSARAESRAGASGRVGHPAPNRAEHAMRNTAFPD